MDDGPYGPEPDDGVPDAELYDRLAAQNFAGAEQEVFEASLVAYAWPILCGWLGSGKIYSKCAEEGRPLWPDGADADELRRDRDERAGLTDETIAYAVVFFREHALHGGAWRPDRGRSLTSYFVTACVLTFPTMFRRWSRGRKQPPTTGYGVDPAAAGLDRMPTSRPAEDPAGLVVDQITSIQELDDMPPKIRDIVEGLLDGRTYAQIGQRLGMSAGAIGEALRRYRKSLRDKDEG